MLSKPGRGADARFAQKGAVERRSLQDQVALVRLRHSAQVTAGL